MSEEIKKRPLSAIAKDIKSKWINPPDKVIEYIHAMSKINKINDTYNNDTGYYILAKFMAYSYMWKSEGSSKIKEEIMYYQD